jgi:DMSO/TMAO reductase YedYZ molybdopterin-dependent catalytic subunit
MTNLIRTLTVLLLLTLASGLLYIAEAQDPCAGGFSPSFSVGGQVSNSTTYDLQVLQKLPTTRVHDVYISGGGIGEGTFTGVLLWDLIEAASVIVGPDQRNDLLRKYVLITGSDCYETVYSIGELSPGHGGSHSVIVAFQRDGERLGPEDGMARIINPGDKFGARRVFNITRIQVLGPPAPQ